jgi:hypothetical protein
LLSGWPTPSLCRCLTGRAQECPGTYPAAGRLGLDHLIRHSADYFGRCSQVSRLNMKICCTRCPPRNPKRSSELIAGLALAILNIQHLFSRAISPSLGVASGRPGRSRGLSNAKARDHGPKSLPPRQPQPTNTQGVGPAGRPRAEVYQRKPSSGRLYKLSFVACISVKANKIKYLLDFTFFEIHVLACDRIVFFEHQLFGRRPRILFCDVEEAGSGCAGQLDFLRDWLRHGGLGSQLGRHRLYKQDSTQ